MGVVPCVTGVFGRHLNRAFHVFVGIRGRRGLLPISIGDSTCSEPSDDNIDKRRGSNFPSTNDEEFDPGRDFLLLPLVEGDGKLPVRLICEFPDATVSVRTMSGGTTTQRTESELIAVFYEVTHWQVKGRCHESLEF